MHSLQEQRVFWREGCLPVSFQVLGYLAGQIRSKSGLVPFGRAVASPKRNFSKSVSVTRLTERSVPRVRKASWGPQRGCPPC